MVAIQLILNKYQLPVIVVDIQKEDIVVAFHEPEMRQYTDFAVGRSSGAG